MHIYFERFIGRRDKDENNIIKWIWIISLVINHKLLNENEAINKMI